MTNVSVLHMITYTGVLFRILFPKILFLRLIHYSYIEKKQIVQLLCTVTPPNNLLPYTHLDFSAGFSFSSWMPMAASC